MVYHVLVMSLIIIEGLLIVISFRYLQKISLASRDFSIVFSKVKGEISLLFQEVKELITITNRREDNILSIVFHLEEIEMHIKMILNKLEQQEKLKVSDQPPLPTNIDKD